MNRTGNPYYLKISQVDDGFYTGDGRELIKIHPVYSIKIDTRPSFTQWLRACVDIFRGTVSGNSLACYLWLLIKTEITWSPLDKQKKHIRNTSDNATSIDY